MSQQRYAYCMGANGPQTAKITPLKYAHRDAEQLANTLKKDPCVFTDTDWIIATNRGSTLTALDCFVKKCEPGSLLVVHFSGHAIYDEELYLLCNETDCGDLETSAIEIRHIKKKLHKSPARYKVLILDCCHAGGAHTGTFKGEGEQQIEDTLVPALKGSVHVILSACSRHERTRELEKLDGGAGFLSWALVASCSTHFEKVSSDNSLSLTDIMHWIPNILREINSSLGEEEERLPQPIMTSEMQGGDGEIWLTEPRVHVSKQQDKKHRLQAMVADHRDRIHNHLESFVGRQKELAEIRQHIRAIQMTGGYLIITGQAGQGKSSVIAKFVEEYGIEDTAYHFIPFNPGPDHQVGLLRGLMAQLILKYDLSDFYVLGDSYPALRDYFPKVLTEISLKGGQEVIFIDGLDQLREDQNGERDLSFLPIKPPEGILFVLGIRPNDTLEQLRQLKAHYAYQLPNLSRHDFDLILVHRNVQLKKSLTDRYYAVMQKNALYLDLVAKELAQEEAEKPEEIIKHLTTNPENIFSFSITRLQRHAMEWREVLKPILGVLLVACEPLTARHIRHLLTIDERIVIDDERLKKGLARLGGLVVDDGRQHYSLFHLKFYEYLRQDDQNSEKNYLFATDEEERCHKKLADWCEQEKLSVIWENIRHDPIEQGRREYARRHYITHLYYAQDRLKLFTVLDDGSYGKAKIHYDPSTHSYAQDLDLGRQAAAWNQWEWKEGLEHLPKLWRYTLLRCSLASRAHKYPPAAFGLLVLLKRVQEAVSLAELLSSPIHKASALIEVAKQMQKQPDLKQESIQTLSRCYEVVSSIDEPNQRAELLCKIAEMLAQAREWEKAKEIIHMIEKANQKVEIEYKLVQAFAQAGEWENVGKFVNTIEDIYQQIKILGYLSGLLSKTQQWERSQILFVEAEAIIYRMVISEQKVQGWIELGRGLADAQEWEQAKCIWMRAQAKLLLRIRKWHSQGEKIQREKIGLTLCKVFAQIGEWEEVEAIAHTLTGSDKRSEVSLELIKGLIHACEWEKAKRYIDTKLEKYKKPELLCELGIALVEDQKWEEGERVIHSIEWYWEREWAECQLGIKLVKIDEWEKAYDIIRMMHWERHIGEAASLGIALAEAQKWGQAKEMLSKVERVLHLKGKIADRDSGQQENDKVEPEPSRNSLSFDQSDHFQVTLDLDRSDALNKIGQALLEAGKDAFISKNTKLFISLCGYAENIIQLADDDFQKWEMLTVLAEALAEAKGWGHAENIIQTISDSWSRAFALSKLSIALAQAQEWERAEALICTMDEGCQQAHLRGKGLALAQEWEDGSMQNCVEKQGLTAEADTIYTIPCILPEEDICDVWKEAEARALSLLGKELTLAQEWEHAYSVWERAENVIWTINDNSQQARTLSLLGEALAGAQEWERAEALIHVIEDHVQQTRALNTLDDTSVQVQEWEHARDIILSALGVSLAQAQEWERAENVIWTINDNSQQARTLSLLGEALAGAQEWERAEALIHVIEDHVQQTRALNTLDNTSVQAQGWEHAEDIILSALGVSLAQAQEWERTETIIRMIKDRRQQTNTLLALVKELLKVKQIKNAKDVLCRSEECIYNIIDEEWSKKSLIVLVEILVQVQEWDHAEAVIHNIGGRMQQKSALSALIQSLAQAQEWERAEAVIQGTEKLWLRAKALSVLGRALAQAQKREDAYKIWADAEALIDKIDYSGYQTEVLFELANAMGKFSEYDLLLHIVQQSWIKHAKTRDEAVTLLPIASFFVPLKPEIGIAFSEAFTWVDMFLQE